MLAIIRASRSLGRTRLRTHTLSALNPRCLHVSLHLNYSSTSAAAPAVPAEAPATDPTISVDASSPSPSTSKDSSKDTPKSPKRRLKSYRSGRLGTRPSLASSDPSSKVYVATIPTSFLATNYHPVASNPYTFPSLPYHIHEGVKTELLNSMASCLLAPHSPQTHIQRMPARHNNILLSSPSEGSSKLLESLTMAAAKRIGADVVTVDMQDLMELTSDMFNGKGAGNPWPVDHLFRGFNPHVTAPIPVDTISHADDDSGDDYSDGPFDEEDDDGVSQHASTESGHLYVDSTLFASRGRHGRHGSTTSATTSFKEKFEQFWTALLLAKPLASTGDSVMTTTTKAAAAFAPTDKEAGVPKVLFLKDIADIIHTSFGFIVIPSLTNSVLTLRKAGHNIMIVAGHSPSLLAARNLDSGMGSDDTLGGFSSGSIDVGTGTDVSLTTVIQKLKSPAEHGHHSHHSHHRGSSSQDLSSLVYDHFPGPTQTFHHISIPPFLPSPPATNRTRTNSNAGGAEFISTEYALHNEALLRKDRADRIREINCRNMATVLRFRGGAIAPQETAEQVFGNLRTIDSEVWGFGKVYRVISNALGALYLQQKHDQPIKEDEKNAATVVLTKETVQNTMASLTTNSNLRKQLASYDWTGKKKPAKPLIRAEDCNGYERRLLPAIVDPDMIKTTFQNTITPPETINTLQTMITLPLIRPQLFSTGLLQNEFLSGLLLFGPPGTGKTLLAKAVAKESGARMLEIKASDIFDIYVGEGEKNVSAVFSLARKLSPCVIFLDEVDSIFRARGSGGNGGGGGSSSGGGNSSQREILNQFMVEWDGLRSSGQNQGIVVMASTNRPFELDDAVLRRLPRRILVDLPSEEAREKILEVYLSQEKLEDEVDIKALAKKTGFFSGSDLKNMCVAAALAAVREDIENEVKALSGDNSSSSSSSSSGNCGLGGDNGDGEKGNKDGKVLDLTPLLNQIRKEATVSMSASTSSSSPKTEPVRERVIGKRHFDKAMQQITPSCSENMDSLTELRKWDGLYGDGGKGRKKALKGIGF
ncbi:hypothetical protein BG004_001830 [Podila humilis]|nr:hypothetical protein BG004_001830 [Podila humilis]